MQNSYHDNVSPLKKVRRDIGYLVMVFCVSVVAFWIADLAQTRGLTTLSNFAGILAALGIGFGVLLFIRASLRAIRAENATLDTITSVAWLRRLDDAAFVRARRRSAALFLLVVPLFLLELVAQRLGYVRFATAVAVMAFASIVTGLGVVFREVFRLHRGEADK